MSTGAVSGTLPSSGIASSGSSATKSTVKTMDQDSFLKLLITEMQNQDPMSPMDNKDSIAQLAQFTSLQQMQQLNQNFTKFGDTFSTSSTATQAYSLTGNWIDYADPADPSVSLTGKVDSVSFENGVPMLKVGTASVDISAITKVYPGYASVGVAKASAQALDLMGKSVSYVDADLGSVKIGVVSGVSFADGWPSLRIDGKKVAVANVLGVSDSSSAVSSSDANTLALALKGKWIGYKDPSNPSALIKGFVKDVDISGSSPMLNVNNKLIGISNVIDVYAPEKVDAGNA